MRVEVKVHLCQDCAAKLRAILHAEGEQAMGRAIGRTLCDACKAGVPGYGARPGARDETQKG